MPIPCSDFSLFLRFASSFFFTFASCSLRHAHTLQRLLLVLTFRLVLLFHVCLLLLAPCPYPAATSPCSYVSPRPSFSRLPPAPCAMPIPCSDFSLFLRFASSFFFTFASCSLRHAHT